MTPYEPEATPQQQEAVRRLLAEARHGEPVPPELAARLDGVLAQLAAEGPRAIDPPPPAPQQAVVVDLAARRRRRVVGLLGAAAAVVVLGVGVTQVVDATSDSGDSSGSAADEQEAGVNQFGTSREPIVPEPLPSQSPSQPGSGAVPGVGSMPSDVPAISRRSFGDSALQLRDRAVVESSALIRLGGDELTSAPLFVCGETSWGDGMLLAVRYAGTPAALAYRPPTGDTQIVELLQCGTGDVLRSKVIPSR